jgi:hypothetical protein
LNDPKDYDLVGIDRDTTIIDGTSSGVPLRISVHYNVSTENFTLRNSNSDGIRATVNGFKILEITNCVVRDNNGHGIKLIDADDFYIRDCEIFENSIRGISAYNSFGKIQSNYIGYNSGGIIAENNSELDIDNCIIEYNITDTKGAAVVAEAPSFEIDIINTIIKHNQTTHEGVIWVESYFLSRCINNYIYNNSENGTRGVIYYYGEVTNNTIVGNTSTWGSGGVFGGGATNNVIAYNSNYGIYSDSHCGGMEHNNIFGNFPTEVHCGGEDFSDMDILNRQSSSIFGNISCDPGFLLPDDYHINDTSCCIDNGTDGSAPSTDLDGDPRPWGAGYDIGADEFYFEMVPISNTTNILLLLSISILICMLCNNFDKLAGYYEKNYYFHRIRRIIYFKYI